MHGNRAIWSDGWWACAKHATPWKARVGPSGNFKDDVWELYAPGHWSQAHDIAAGHPDKLAEMIEPFDKHAVRNNVYPLDDRHLERFLPELAGRPDNLLEHGTVELAPTAIGLGEGTAPNVKNRSFRLTVGLSADDFSRCDGALVAQGRRFGRRPPEPRSAYRRFRRRTCRSHDRSYGRGALPPPCGAAARAVRTGVP